MSSGLEAIKKQIKKNIQMLTNESRVAEAEALIDQYCKMVSDDVDIYSMKATVLVMQGLIDEAEQALQEGLHYDKTNYDLMFNLAYIYEMKQEYLKALIAYRKTLRAHYYVIDRTEVEIRIDEIKKAIREGHASAVEVNAARVDNILFVDFNNTQEVNHLAKVLDKYGINVDIAYSGKAPMSNFVDGINPYRKIIEITDVNDFVEYTKYYNYEGIHLFNRSDTIKNLMESKGLPIKCDNLYNKAEEALIMFFGENLLPVFTQHLYKENKEFTILLPTYNRPQNFKQVIQSIANYRYIKPRVIVLDSSFTDKKSINKNIVNEIRNRLNVEYVEFSSETFYVDKIYYGLEQITTNFFVICPDDDFYAEEGLMKSLEIMEESPAVFSVKGKNMYFLNSPSHLMEYEQFRTLSQENAIERLRTYTSGFAAILGYQVFRTKEYVRFYRYYQNNREKECSPIFAEYLGYFLFIITGKIIKINMDLNIRNKGIEREFEVKNFDDEILENTFNENYGKLVKYMIGYSDDIGVAISYSEIEEIFISFLVNFLRVPAEFISIESKQFNMDKLEQGMRKSWVWKS